MADHALCLQPTTSKIELQPMVTHVDTAEDNWSGIGNPVLRRRIQNRLNQRAYRYRKRISRRAPDDPRSHRPPTDVVVAADDTALWETLPISSHSRAQRQALRWTWAPPDLPELMMMYERRATESYRMGTPQADHLISLSRLNIWRAANDNIVAAGMTVEYLWADESISLFSVSSANIITENVPVSLLPTTLQRTIPHHSWIDVYPFPEMRDNLLRRGEAFDEDDLCRDLIGFWDTRRSDATLLVWGVPWDPMNWEVSESYARKWGWTIRGCPEILKSTNRWRTLRGEKPIMWQDVLSVDVM